MDQVREQLLMDVIRYWREEHRRLELENQNLRLRILACYINHKQQRDGIYRHLSI